MAALDNSRSANGGNAARRLAAPLGFLVAAGVVLGLFGPFGTFQAFDLPARVAYWVGAVLAVGGVNIAVRRLVERRLDVRLGWIGVVALASLLSALPGSALVLLTFPAVLPDQGAAPTLTVVFGQVLLVNLILNVLAVGLARRAAPAAVEAAPKVEASPDARWRERLPAALRDAPLLALEAEDHYLRVHTAAGSTLILLRLGDAIAELGPARGAQVHRSFWVARDAVERVERQGEKVALVLCGGLRVPVSRGNRAKLALMGWE